MTSVYAKLHHVDYGKLLARIKSAKKQPRRAGALQQVAGNLAATPLSLKILAKRPMLIKAPITNLLTEYGVSLSVLKIGGDTLIHERTGGSNMLKITASIESIDYGKLARAISRPRKTNAAESGDKLMKAANILEPFIDNTMATMPASALAELFALFAKEKVVEMADWYGIKLADVSMEPDLTVLPK